MPYTATDGLLQENIDLAERIAASIVPSLSPLLPFTPANASRSRTCTPKSPSKLV